MVALTVTEPALRETRFRAMGTDVHIAVVGADESVLRQGQARIRELEGRWSRFIDSSELTALNRSEGRPVVVSLDTFELVERAVQAWRMTDGRFDPTVAKAVIASGYDRDFDELTGLVIPQELADLPPGLDGVEAIAAIHAITLPRGVTIDAGGIGKGLAADLTAELLMDLGAEGAMVNLGGDLRAVGRAADPEGWVITVPDPLDSDHELLRLAMAEGAVATSSRLLRRWRTTTGEAHHLIDPGTGRPAQTDVVAVTVVSSRAWWAEALTKSLFLSGPAGLGDLDDMHAVIVMADGTRHFTPMMEATLR